MSDRQSIGVQCAERLRSQTFVEIWRWSSSELPVTRVVLVVVENIEVCVSNQAQAMERYLVAGFTLGRVLAVILLCVCGVPATLALSQTGFLNIDCGATEKYVDPGTGLSWVPDAPYITTGKIQSSLSLPASLQNFTEMKSLRYFDNFRPDDPQTKYCYTLPVIANTIYMLRTTFYYGNYDNAGKPSTFQLAIDATIVDNVTTVADDGLYSEFQYVSQGNSTFLCLIRTSPQSTPFISGITLKPAGPLMDGYNEKFNEFLQQGIIMSTLARVNFGGPGMIRFPTDIYDRFWFAESQTIKYYLTPTISLVEFLSTNSTIPFLVGAGSDPPSEVMQTAVTSSGSIISYLIPPDLGDGHTVYLSVYYVELVSSGTPTPRQFSIEIPGSVANINTTGIFLKDYGGWDFWPSGGNIGRNSTMTMTPDTTSLRGPILNAMEVFGRSAQRASKTIDRDALAIEAIKLSLNLPEWTGDPCLPIPHSWVTCSSDSTTLQPQIAAVDLSGYGLEGILPPSFANLAALTSLRLENNKLSGPLPDWLTYLKNLKLLSIQNNNFSGPIPAALLSPNDSLLFTYSPGNPFLYGGAPVCTGSNCGKPNVAVIAGASIGGVLGLVLISLIVFFAFRRCPRDRRPNSNDDPQPSIRRIGTTGGAKAYTLAEVTTATKNFTTELGKGGFGPVYYGKLPDGQEVAVKVADGASQQGEKEFFNEVDVLSRVHHKNLVRLVGYCQEKKQILMYEYMHKGSLFDHLHGKPVNTVGMLDWKTRLHIALNAAQGLEYLHTGCSPSFIHRDVKSSNILLSPKCDAKVADFGMTRLMGEAEETKVMTLVIGTAGYLDPEYYTTQQVSSKSDVFSFGIVLLELLTGRLPIHRSPAMEMHPNISNWVRDSLKNSDIDSILDPAVKASNPNMEAVWKVAEIAMRSVEPKGIYRPTMSEVVQELLGAVTMEGTSLPPPSHTRMNSGYSDYSSGFQYAPTSYPAPR